MEKYAKHIFVICSAKYEPTRYPMMKSLVDSMKIPEDQYSFMCPTYKTTITDDIMTKYVKCDAVRTVLGRHMGMKRSEISLFLNFKAILETIRSSYTEGMFITFESDVVKLKKTIGDFETFLKGADSSVEKWDVIDVGSNTGISGRPNVEEYTGPDKDLLLTVDDKTFHLTRMKMTRCTDSLIWSYSGVIKFLHYLETNPYYEYPLDYYMDDFFHSHTDFRFYWSDVNFFIQTSNLGMCHSTIK